MFTRWVCLPKKHLYFGCNIEKFELTVLSLSVLIIIPIEPEFAAVFDGKDPAQALDEGWLFCYELIKLIAQYFLRKVAGESFTISSGLNKTLSFWRVEHHKFDGFVSEKHGLHQRDTSFMDATQKWYPLETPSTTKP